MLQEDDIIIYLLSAIAEGLGKKDRRHPLGKLYLSEILLCGVLFALKGGSFRQFHPWLQRRNMLNLPERSRLCRLLIKYHKHCNQFLSTETFFNIIDSFGVEVIHPVREERSTQSQIVSRKGKSNKRWIIGRKINVAINGELEIIDYQDDTDNVCDNSFDTYYEKRQEHIYLTDNGYRKQAKYGGTPDNFKICKKGTWNDERMWVERLFSLWVRICGMKHSFHRTVKGFQAKVAYLVVLTNITFRLNESLGFHKCSLVQWAL
jgi:hypothetical protein